MGDLSKNFSRHEFACKCGCGFNTVDVELLDLCEEVREIAGVPITPTSGCRCSAHNLASGGGKRSQHLFGRAVDLPVPDPKKVFDELCKRYPDEYGFGRYMDDGFVHVDSRSNGPATWTDS